jgi:hypothetical protein
VGLFLGLSLLHGADTSGKFFDDVIEGMSSKSKDDSFFEIPTIFRLKLVTKETAGEKSQ